ncbi:unnamed protein product [Dibothriocephalus latus]|uniref:ubiquitinyl hydrolase 1 n=1 Tax=Dibothriocephalus latus TaxID=60516 RepID=A0A3P7QHY4_DIBLA|nr:unnamed protein product [Dibothriocephalus latus]
MILLKHYSVDGTHCVSVPSRFFRVDPTDGPHQKLDLNLCFELFTTEETLSAQSPWYCKECTEPRQASKKLDFWCLPEVLIIHLKRFRTVFPMEKINEFVDFPVEGLKIRNSRQEEHTYDLVAVSNHMGGLLGGHYTAKSCGMSVSFRALLFP